MFLVLKRGKQVKNLKPRVIFVGIVFLLIMVIAVHQSRIEEDNSEEDFVSAEFEESAQLEMRQSEIAVHVAGAVLSPGVYTLQEGQRVEDALQLAGISEDSDVDALNRASILVDGQKIIVPSLEEKDTISVENQTDLLIDLNQADVNQLMTLPGIGEVKAQAILDYRTQQGSFCKIEDIQKVNGIGKAIYEQIKNKIKI